MTEPLKALLLVGSARQPSSTSAALGGYLLARLAERGLTTEQHALHATVKSEERLDEVLTAVDQAEVVVLVCPLYFHSLPFTVTRLCERLAVRRAAGPPRRQRLLAILNCGFPEASNTHTALAICRRFAAEASFEWVGGLGLGGGPMIDGRPLEQVGRTTLGVRRALDLAAAALADDVPLPDEAVQLMARPMCPRWMYNLIANVQFRREARRLGSHEHLCDRPFEEVDEGGQR